MINPTFRYQQFKFNIWEVLKHIVNNKIYSRQWVIEISVAIRGMSTYKTLEYWSDGVQEYWKDELAEKRPTPQYSCLNYGDHIQDL